MVMRELHEEPSRRHFATEIMHRKILVANYVQGHA
jgi:hypothetical protein